MSLNTYGFVDDIYMKSKSFEVSVSAKDKIIQVMDGNTLLASLSMALTNNVLSLIGKNDMIVAEVELPQSKLIKNIYYNSETKQIVIEIIMEDGSESEITIDVQDLVTIYEGCNGVEINGNKIGIKINEESSKYLSADDDGLAINIETLDNTFATDEDLKNFATLDELNLKADKADIEDMATKTWVNEQGFITEHQDLSNLVTKEEFNNLENNVSNKVDWTDISTENNPNRKSIVLKNHDTILGTDTKGHTYNIGMISKWDVVDLGSTTLPINLNTPSGVRPTVQEAGQSGEEANKIAYLTDIQNLEEKIENIEINTDEVLKDYAKKDHNHDDMYSKLGHTHDEYITEDELNIDLSNKVDWSEFELNGEKRKSIVLGNYDTLLGTDTKGQTYNIGMISKWDKVDLGTASLEINLNGSAERPTYNDEKEIALMDDVNEINNNIEININEVLKDYAKKDHNHDDMYSKLGHTHDEYITEDELNIDLSNKVDWSDISTEDNPNRKSIVLKNHDTILGTDTSGNTRSILMVNKWDVVDLGTTTLPINLNTPSGVRPTVQEAGQSGEEANKIAYLTDIDKTKEDISETLKNYITIDIHQNDLNKKQDKLIPGNNITIENNIISCTYDSKLFVILTDDTLPNVGENNKIYLLPNKESAINNQFTEYYYNNGIWEIIGEYKPEIDLSAYITNKKWETEIPPCVDSKFTNYTTISDVRNICQEEINSSIDNVLSESKSYTDNEIINAKNEISLQINEKNSIQNEVIADNSNRILDLENRCNHFDDLFAMILAEHGDPIDLNFYTKEETDKKFALKEELLNKVDWVQIGNNKNTQNSNLFKINEANYIQTQINELKEKIIKLEDKLNNLLK